MESLCFHIIFVDNRSVITAEISKSDTGHNFVQFTFFAKLLDQIMHKNGYISNTRTLTDQLKIPNEK